MSSGLLSPVFKQRFFDLNGLPLSGGFAYFYTAGTNTPQATYTDSTLATPNTNPVVLDSAGYANIWFATGFYKVILTDSLGTVQFTVDNVSGGSANISPFSPQTFTIADNQSAYANITSMLVDQTVNRCMQIEYTMIRSDGTNKRREHGTLILMYDSQNGWVLVRNSQGADALNVGGTSLAITAGGQVQYKSDSMGGTYAGKMIWQVISSFASEGI